MPKGAEIERKILHQPLVKWILTFKSDIGMSRVSSWAEIIESKYLLFVLELITENEIASSFQLKNLDPLKFRFVIIKSALDFAKEFYKRPLNQMVMLPPPHLPSIVNYETDPECQEHIDRLLILILGCSTQCARKDMFIERINSELDGRCQNALTLCFQELANNTMTCDISQLNLTHEMELLCEHINQLISSRDEVFAKCMDQFQSTLQSEVERKISERNHTEKLNKHLETSKSEIARLNDEIFQLKVDLKTRGDKIESLEAQNSTQTQTGTSGTTDGGGKESGEQEQRITGLKSEVYGLKQQLMRLNYYKEALEDVRGKLEASKEQNAVVSDRLSSSQNSEKILIEKFTDCQIQLDEMRGNYEAERLKYLQTVKLSSSGGVSSNKQTAAMANELKNFQRENENLQSQLQRMQQREDSETNNWRYLNVQKEKMQLVSELREAESRVKQLEQQAERVRVEAERSAREAANSQHEYADRLAGQQKIVEELQNRVQSAAKQNVVLRRQLVMQRGRHAPAHTRAQHGSSEELEENEEELETELEENLRRWTEMESGELQVMHEAVQELISQIHHLKIDNQTLRECCDRLKFDVEKVIAIEEENRRLHAENVRVRENLILYVAGRRKHQTDTQDGESKAQQEKQQQTASTCSKRERGERAAASEEIDGDGGDMEELKMRNLKLELENAKLRRIVESLRSKMLELDPNNRFKYIYISSM